MASEEGCEAVAFAAASVVDSAVASLGVEANVPSTTKISTPPTPVQTRVWRLTVLLPEEVVESIRMTIARALDYCCDVFSCSPEQLRLTKTEESVRSLSVSCRLSPAGRQGRKQSVPRRLRVDRLNPMRSFAVKEV